MRLNWSMRHKKDMYTVCLSASMRLTFLTDEDFSRVGDDEEAGEVVLRVTTEGATAAGEHLVTALTEQRVLNTGPGVPGPGL